MAKDKKYGQVTLQYKALPPDEPVFVLRGQDRATPNTIRRWAIEAEAIGADRETVAEAEHVAGLIEAWQQANPDRVKVPD